MKLLCQPQYSLFLNDSQYSLIWLCLKMSFLCLTSSLYLYDFIKSAFHSCSIAWSLAVNNVASPTYPSPGSFTTGTAFLRLRLQIFPTAWSTAAGGRAVVVPKQWLQCPDTHLIQISNLSPCAKRHLMLVNDWIAAAFLLQWFAVVSKWQMGNRLVSSMYFDNFFPIVLQTLPDETQPSSQDIHQAQDCSCMDV